MVIENKEINTISKFTRNRFDMVERSGLINYDLMCLLMAAKTEIERCEVH